MQNTTTSTSTLGHGNITLTVTWNPENLIIDNKNITNSSGANNTFNIKSHK